jgi:predicted  nucleic acid-binding Zn-ribbon protein
VQTGCLHFFFYRVGGIKLQNTLYSLIELQEIDLKLDKVQQEKGDLPRIVDELKTKINDRQNQLAAQKEEIGKLKIEIKKLELELKTGKNQLEKYENQLYKVKTNKEYDAIANETDNVKKKIREIENKVLHSEENMEKLSSSNESIDKELVQLKKEFEENNAVLQEKISASAEEENLLRQERRIVADHLTSQQINSYERIRDAKKGMAVASCNGGVCSGCHSFIPPQTVVEIRGMKRMFHCESCGRILVWDKNEE